MDRENFTDYDILPPEMINYKRHYGSHFNKKMVEFAVSKMTTRVNGVEKPLKPYTKNEVDSMFEHYKVELKHNQLYDYVYVANMCKADFLGSSILNEELLTKYIKDVIDDVDAPDGLVFNRWYADMCYMGIAIDWESML